VQKETGKIVLREIQKIDYITGIKNNRKGGLIMQVCAELFSRDFILLITIFVCYPESMLWN